MRTDDQEARIRQILQQHGRLEGTIETMARDAELSAAGLTSHATVSVMLALEEEFGIEFPDQMLTRGVFTSIASIHSAIETLAPAA
jgi:acyl carrier protein